MKLLCVVSEMYVNAHDARVTLNEPPPVEKFVGEGDMDARVLFKPIEMWVPHSEIDWFARRIGKAIILKVEDA